MSHFSLYRVVLCNGAAYNSCQFFLCCDRWQLTGCPFVFSSLSLRGSVPDESVRAISGLATLADGSFMLWCGSEVEESTKVTRRSDRLRTGAHKERCLGPSSPRCNTRPLQAWHLATTTLLALGAFSGLTCSGLYDSPGRFDRLALLCSLGSSSLGLASPVLASWTRCGFSA